MRSRVFAAGVAALVVLCVLLGLGTWQMHRLRWKQDVIARITHGLAQPAKPMDAPGLGEFDHVYADGTLAADKPLFVYGRIHGGRAGVAVINRLQTASDQILVDRGFLILPVDPGSGNPRAGEQSDRRYSALSRGQKLVRAG